MAERHQPRILLLTLIVAGVAAVTVFVFNDAPAQWIAGTTARVAEPLARRIGYGRAFIAVLTGRTDLIRENMDLENEVERARAAAARAEEMERENRFLRAALGLSERTGQHVLPAGAFAYLREGGIRELIINKGSWQRVAPGDVVTTENGSLVGVVAAVYDTHSAVRMVGDPALEITGRIQGTEISGLVRVDGQSGLILDLVRKEEPVSEGNVIVTSGNDQFPGGLIIGTVRSVDSTSATLFQTVRVSPAVPENLSAPVLIVRP